MQDKGFYHRYRYQLCHIYRFFFPISDSHRLPFEKLEPAVSTLTHILYGPAYLSTNNQLVPAHHADVDAGDKEGMYRKVTALKKLNPNLKVLLSVGRRDYDETRTTHYVNFLLDKKAREEFIHDALNVVKKYGFDGIDLAWEFPRYKKNPLMSEKVSHFFPHLTHFFSKTLFSRFHFVRIGKRK